MIALHIIQRYLPAKLTGSERGLVIVSEVLAQHQSKYTVNVLTSNVGPGEGFYDPRQKRITKNHETIHDVKITRLPVNWLKASFYYGLMRFFPWLNALTGGRLAILSFGPQLVGLEAAILKSKPDLVHVSPMPMAHTYATWQICRRHNIPLVITPTMHFEDKRFENPMIYTMLQQCEGIIVHTDYERQRLIDSGISADRLSVIPSSYMKNEDFQAGDARRFRHRYQLTDGPIVLFIGSKSYDKGTVTLLVAWPKVLARVPEAQLVIAGLMTRSYMAAKQGKVMTNVTELDYITESEKNDALTACQLLCVPSRSESFGMILLEAWAKGKPVIGGSAGATRELIEEGKDGYTVEFGDTMDLAKKIIKLLSNPSKATALGLAGQQKARQFTKTEIVKKTITLYDRVSKTKKWLPNSSSIKMNNN